MTLYGNIYHTDGTTVKMAAETEIRRLSGNPRIESLSDEAIESARIGASERVERETRRENVLHNAGEVELYNLMSKATNYYASAEVMGPYNDKQEARKINITEAEKICKQIREFESSTDTTVEVIDPSVTSSYSTSAFGVEGDDGMFAVTMFGGGRGFVNKSGVSFSGL